MLQTNLRFFIQSSFYTSLTLMKHTLCILLFFITLSSPVFAVVELTYHKEGVSYAVDGFDLNRPFTEENGEKKYLPLEGTWGLQIGDESFWDSVYYPRSYILIKKHKTYSDDSYTLAFDADNIPVAESGAEDFSAVKWKEEDFSNSVVGLGWYHNGAVTSVEIARTNVPIHGGIMEDAYSTFLISGNHLDGFPFIWVMDGDSLELRKPEQHFTKENPGYFYRLACRGSPEDFEALDPSPKFLSQILIHEKLTLLHGASLYGNVEVLRYLKEIKADKIKEDGRYPVISHAIYGNRLEAVKLLMEYGFDPLDEGRRRFLRFLKQSNFDGTTSWIF
jgi:hypothetical protein